MIAAIIGTSALILMFAYIVNSNDRETVHLQKTQLQEAEDKRKEDLFVLQQNYEWKLKTEKDNCLRRIDEEIAKYKKLIAAKEAELAAKEAEFAERERVNNKALDEVEAERSRLDEKEWKLDVDKAITLRRKKEYEEKIEQLKGFLDDKFPFNKVAELRADAIGLVFDKAARFLTNKSRPATQTAAEIKGEMKQMCKESEYNLQLMRYKYDFLLAQFPQLQEYVDDFETVKMYEDIDDIEEAGNFTNRARKWLSDEEWKRLSETERLQLALDRWKSRGHKTNTEVGFEYEMFIGHKYREDGWKVEQFGIDRGLDDLGRDIIATKITNDHVMHIDIIQCKRWNQNLTIHENAICQLYGTTIQYKIKNRLKLPAGCVVRPVFATTTELSETAQEFAKTLGVMAKVAEMGDYPCIKCHISRTGEKIYHLPFDQQYYRTNIDAPEEKFVYTVAEAEALGFRHAMRYRGIAN